MAIAVVIESIEVNEDTIEVTYDGGGQSIPIAGLTFEEIKERAIAEQPMQSGDELVSLVIA